MDSLNKMHIHTELFINISVFIEPPKSIHDTKFADDPNSGYNIYFTGFCRPQEGVFKGVNSELV